MGPEERFRDGMGICLVAIARNLFFFYRPTMGLECVNGGSWTRMMPVIEVDDAGREWRGCRFDSISRNEKKRENLIVRKFGKGESPAAAVNSRVIVFAVTLIRWLIWSTNMYVYIVFV